MGSTSQNHLGLGITTISSIKHGSYTIQNSHQTSSTSLPGLLLCWSKNYNAPMRAFFSRFVVHQTVLQCVFFFAVCRAPNRAPMRAFSRGLSCTKSCSTLWFLAWCVFWEIVAGGFSAMFAIFSLSLFHPPSLKPFGMEEPMPRMKWKNQHHFIHGPSWKTGQKTLKFWCHVAPLHFTQNDGNSITYSCIFLWNH